MIESDKERIHQLIECVPNISAGRDKNKVDAVVDAIASVSNVWVLDIDSGPDVDRSVITFVSTEESAVEAGFECIQKGLEVIDMRQQQGVHPRMGAVDVFPFVPLDQSSLDTGVSLARQLGQRVGVALQLPVFLYETAALYPNRKNLANIRSSQFEGLADQLKNPEWIPDYGPHEPHPTGGAIAIGARPLMIAYNINLKTKDVSIAKKIAGELRESGYVIQNKAGQKLRILGAFTSCKAIGWYLESCGCVQVSMNLTNFHNTPPHRVYEKCKELAESLDTEVAGSEIVGLTPLEAMLHAGRHFLKFNDSNGLAIPDAELIRAAAEGLGLDKSGSFNPRQKILEYRIEDVISPLRPPFRE